MRHNQGLIGFISFGFVYNLVAIGVVEIGLDGSDLFRYCAQID